MTEPRKINRKPSENQELVSFRLPSSLLRELDQLVEIEQSSRTSVLRRSIATYVRLKHAVLVPASDKTKGLIVRLADQRQCSPETMASDLLRDAVEKTAAQQDGAWHSKIHITLVTRGRTPPSTSPTRITMDLFQESAQ